MGYTKKYVKKAAAYSEKPAARGFDLKQKIDEHMDKHNPNTGDQEAVKNENPVAEVLLAFFVISGGWLVPPLAGLGLSMAALTVSMPLAFFAGGARDLAHKIKEKATKTHSKPHDLKT